jgi:hypothetical protein
MKLSFSDFWGGFQHTNNFFADLIKTINPKMEVIPLGRETDILIYSCFGSNHYTTDRSRTKKIFYTGENIRPNYSECDYSLTFDFEDYDGRNCRLPLWMLQIDWFNKKDYENPKFVIPVDQINKNAFIERPKTDFCCMIFNTDSPFRFETLAKLSRYKYVTTYGKPFGNWFYGEEDKYQVLAKHKFSVCFENTLHPGYYTEKLFHAKVAGTVPIYWADRHIKEDFNVKGFINLSDFNGVDELIEYIKQVDTNDLLYKQYTGEPLFNVAPNLNRVKQFLQNIL